MQFSILYIRRRISDFEKNISFKPTALAPIVVEILMSRGSAYKIVADSGIKLQKKISSIYNV
jgi:preprotein translocase subunit SecB